MLADSGQFIEDTGVEDCDIGSGEGGISDGGDLFGAESWEHAAVDRVLGVHVSAEAAGEVEFIDLGWLEVELFEEGEDSGRDGRLGLEQMRDIDTGNDDRGVSIGMVDAKSQVVLVVAPRQEAIGQIVGGVADESAGRGKESDFPSLGEEVDVGGSAQSGGRGVVVLADDGGLHGRGIGGETDGADSAIACADAGGEPRAFEGRACGRGTAEELVAVFEDDLAVGADVDEEAWSLVVEQSGGGDAGDQVCADIGCGAWEEVDLGVFCAGEGGFRRIAEHVGGVEDAVLEE